MKQYRGTHPRTGSAAALMRLVGTWAMVLGAALAHAQGGDVQVRAKADALFGQAAYAEALPLYSQLVSLEPSDRVLNYRFGACLLFGADDKERAIGHLKYATEDPAIPAEAWYWMGRAYHLNYRFREALVAYQRYKGVADSKLLANQPVAALEQQCRNGQKLLANLKEINVRSKVEVDAREFFRFYDLSDIGGRIVVTPDELKSSLDKKNKLRSLVYLPERPGPIYFSSYGKDGRTGLDIYRTELMPDGRFSTPVKLAGFINTEEDEDFPFMHPDGKTFYFSSRGHSSMGGYDVFKATYDRGLDAFGRPENLDFAVNTPDDDVFFVVDATHGEACFASGRSSRQGMYHVYRVSTERMPLVITVLKGTFASEFDEKDRKARIVVEDAVTREQVANVRTDMNGNYVLSLPRSGRFRFMVECGPSGRTHVGMVDVPRSDGPRGYRQELTLVRHGDQEKLMIRNYFDSPLDDDLIELAMAEILRRARLDISEERPAAQASTAPAAPSGDVLTRAGFTGDVDKEAALRMARNDAASEERLASELAAQRSQAVDLALEAVEEAERSAREAQDLVDQAGRENDEEARNARMVQAARARQQSREATLRARAAQRTVEDLEAEELATRQRAAQASKLSADLQATLGAGSDELALPHLVTLKQRMDEKSGPNARPDMAEAARRAVGEQERLANRALQQANDKRVEDGELVDRINRLKRERASTRGKGRQDELDREIAQLEEQLVHLRRETEAAYAKASTLERETAVLRGRASLMRYLSTNTGGTTSRSGPTTTQVAAIGQRIAGAESKVAVLSIDERFDALLTATPAEVEARTFNWALASTSARADAGERTATRAADRTTQGDARTTTTRGTTVQGGEAPQRSLQQGVVPDVPVSNDAPDVAVATPPTTREGAVPDPARRANVDDVRPPTTDRSNTAGGEAGQTAAAARSGGQDASTGGRDGAGDPSVASGDQRSSQQADAGVPPSGLTPEQVRNADVAPAAGSDRSAVEPPLDSDPFLVENRIAELRQLMQAERNRTRRDSLQAQIDQLEVQREQLVTATQGVDPDAKADTERLRQEVGLGPVDAQDMARIPLVIEPSTTSDEIRTRLFADYQRDRKMLAQVTDGDQRAESLQGLELMMADSIRAEMSRQVALLELDPAQAERVLPRLDRLRRLREEHVALADQHLIDRRNEMAAARTTAGGALAPLPSASKAVALDERYVSFAPMKEDVYASDVAFRSTAIAEALASQKADVEAIGSLEQRIDSVDAMLTSLGSGRDRERLQREVDKIRDERLILRTDVGQRSAFLTREEWTSATDSLKRLERMLNSKGVASDEPVLLLAGELRSEAQRRRDQATQLRRSADRGSDIVARDSLYRAAYATELMALRDLERAIILQNHLLGMDHVPGEQLSFEQVAARIYDAEAYEGRSGQVAAAPGRSTADTVPVRSATDADRVPSVPPAGLADGAPATSQQHESDRAADGERSTTDGVVSGVASEVSGDQGRELAERDRPARRTSTEQDGPLGPDQPAGQAGTGVAGSDDPQPGGTRSAGGAVMLTPEELAGEAQARREGREIALAQVRAAEAQLDEATRRPVNAFEDLLAPAPVPVVPKGLEDLPDPAALALESELMARESDRLALEASELRQQAAEQEANTATVKRRERAALQQLAVRNRQVADSLEAASVSKREQSRAIADEQRDVEQLVTFRERLVKFYYLTNDERAIIMDNPDGSRYFEARMRAQEQDEAAAEAEAAAAANRDLAIGLRRDAGPAQRSAVGATAVRNDERVRVLNEEADRLQSRADSLTAVALQLRTAARANAARAESLLGSMDQADATRLADMERGARATVGLRVDTRTAADQPAPTGTADAARMAAGSGDVPTAPVTMPDRMPNVLTADLFQFRVGSSRSGSTNAITEEMPGGIVYTVQVGAFRNAIPEGTFGDLSPVMAERLDNGLTRYKAGLFTTLGSATTARDQVRARGYRDAFVVVYRDGQRITLAEAQREPGVSGTVAQATRPAGPPTTAPMSTPGAQPAVPLRPSGQAPTEPPPVAQQPAGTLPAAAPPSGRGGDGENTAPGQVRTDGIPSTRPAAPDPAQEAAAVLANYPPSAAAIVEAFSPEPARAAYYSEPGAAPARQVETIRGLFFTVQVGVYSRPVPLDKLFNITPLNSELTGTQKIRYTTGIYLNEELARQRRDQAVQLGVKDAFITAYLNGERIPMRDARLLLDRFGTEILARP